LFFHSNVQVKTFPNSAGVNRSHLRPAATTPGTGRTPDRSGMGRTTGGGTVMGGKVLYRMIQIYSELIAKIQQ
jgi:hypothetical protein